MSNIHDKSHTNISDDRLGSSLPSRIGPYRSLSAKRPRDPSNRKSVSFNDVPIVHEVPSHDTMRNSNSDIYRSWIYTDATSSMSVSSPFTCSQILSPFNSTSAAAQKLHANRLSSALYSSTNNTPHNRSSDWTIRGKSSKTIDETTEHQTNSNPPLIIIHTPDDRTIKHSSITLPIFSENAEEKKNFYRSAVVPDTEHYRSLPFTYTPLSESTTTYTSMLSTNLIQSNDHHSPNGHSRVTRARSATLPITVIHSPTRNNDNISITPFRPTNNSLSRTILKPTTIAFHSSSYTTPTVLPSNTSISKPPVIPPRSSSFIAHSRFVSSSSNRPLSSTIKQTIDSISKSPSTALTRSRSANVLSTKRYATSPVVMLSGQSGGTKHNPNMRQTYGSCYMQHISLPANIN